MLIYETTVKGIGKNAKEFESTNMLVTFGENVPDTLKDYCYIIDITKTTEKVKPGMSLHIADEVYEITSVGEHGINNLNSLGHLTISFNVKPESELPGTMYVSGGKFPSIEVGSKIQIKS